MMLLDQALAVACSDTELNALALTLIMATSVKGMARNEKYEAAELRYLSALMSYEKACIPLSVKPSLRNILLLLEQDHLVSTEPALKDVWREEDVVFRNAILRSLGMRLTEVCEAESKSAYLAGDITNHIKVKKNLDVNSLKGVMKLTTELN